VQRSPAHGVVLAVKVSSVLLQQVRIKSLKEKAGKHKESSSLEHDCGGSIAACAGVKHMFARLGDSMQPGTEQLHAAITC
jgi:hypothetical protein